MALDAGDAGCTHGLSKRIHDAMLANPCGAVDGSQLKNFAYAISTAVVAEIQANAQAVLPGGGAVYALVSSQVLGGMPASTAQHTPIESLSAAGILPVQVPVQGANLAIT